MVQSHPDYDKLIDLTLPISARDIKGKGTDYGPPSPVIDSNTPAADPEHDGLVAKTFLEETRHQLTYYGLATLVGGILDPGEVAVLFRNNHFCTVVNHVLDQGGFELCSLVTDSGTFMANDRVH